MKLNYHAWHPAQLIVHLFITCSDHKARDEWCRFRNILWIFSGESKSVLKRISLVSFFYFCQKVVVLNIPLSIEDNLTYYIVESVNSSQADLYRDSSNLTQLADHSGPAL